MLNSTPPLTRRHSYDGGSLPPRKASNTASHPPQALEAARGERAQALEASVKAPRALAAPPLELPVPHVREDGSLDWKAPAGLAQEAWDALRKCLPEDLADIPGVGQATLRSRVGQAVGLLVAGGLSVNHACELLGTRPPLWRALRDAPVDLALLANTHRPMLAEVCTVAAALPIIVALLDGAPPALALAVMRMCPIGIRQELLAAVLTRPALRTGEHPLLEKLIVTAGRYALKHGRYADYIALTNLCPLAHLPALARPVLAYLGPGAAKHRPVTPMQPLVDAVAALLGQVRKGRPADIVRIQAAIHLAATLPEHDGLRVATLARGAIARVREKIKRHDGVADALDEQLMALLVTLEASLESGQPSTARNRGIVLVREELGQYGVKPEAYKLEQDFEAALDQGRREDAARALDELKSLRIPKDRLADLAFRLTGAITRNLATLGCTIEQKRALRYTRLPVRELLLLIAVEDLLGEPQTAVRTAQLILNLSRAILPASWDRQQVACDADQCAVLWQLAIRTACNAALAGDVGVALDLLHDCDKWLVHLRGKSAKEGANRELLDRCAQTLAGAAGRVVAIVAHRGWPWTPAVSTLVDLCICEALVPRLQASKSGDPRTAKQAAAIRARLDETKFTRSARAELAVLSGEENGADVTGEELVTLLLDLDGNPAAAFCLLPVDELPGAWKKLFAADRERLRLAGATFLTLPELRPSAARHLLGLEDTRWFSPKDWELDDATAFLHAAWDIDPAWILRLVRETPGDPGAYHVRANVVAVTAFLKQWAGQLRRNRGERGGQLPALTQVIHACMAHPAFSTVQREESVGGAHSEALVLLASCLTDSECNALAVIEPPSDEWNALWDMAVQVAAVAKSMGNPAETSRSIADALRRLPRQGRSPLLQRWIRDELVGLVLRKCEAGNTAFVGALLSALREFANRYADAPDQLARLICDIPLSKAFAESRTAMATATIALLDSDVPTDVLVAGLTTPLGAWFLQLPAEAASQFCISLHAGASDAQAKAKLVVLLVYMAEAARQDWQFGNPVDAHLAVLLGALQLRGMKASLDRAERNGLRLAIKALEEALQEGRHGQ